jgi:hypothetical protein
MNLKFVFLLLHRMPADAAFRKLICKQIEFRELAEPADGLGSKQASPCREARTMVNPGYPLPGR